MKALDIKKAIEGTDGVVRIKWRSAYSGANLCQIQRVEGGKVTCLQSHRYSGFMRITAPTVSIASIHPVTEPERSQFDDLLKVYEATEAQARKDEADALTRRRVADKLSAFARMLAYGINLEALKAEWLTVRAEVDRVLGVSGGSMVAAVAALVEWGSR